MVPVFPRFAGGNNELCAHSTQNKGTTLRGLHMANKLQTEKQRRNNSFMIFTSFISQLETAEK